MGYISNEDFKDAVGDKIGNVRFFKKLLNDNGILKRGESLSESFISIFLNAKENRKEEGITWEQAFNNSIEQYCLNKEDLNLINEGIEENRQILDVLLRIEKVLLRIDEKLK